MFFLSLYLVVVASVILFSEATPVCSVRDGNDPDAMNRFFNTMTLLNGECLNCLNELNPRTSQTTAMASLISTLAQLALEANGSTFDDLIHFIGLRGRNQIKGIVPAYDEFRMQKNMKFDFIVFTDIENTFRPYFNETYDNYFGGETKNIDLSDPKMAANFINDWVTSKSCRNNEVISAKQLCESTGLIFISFYELVVVWDDSFTPCYTVTMDFYRTKNETTKLSALYGSGEVTLTENAYLNAKVIEIQLTKLSLVIIYPNEMDGLSSVLYKARDPEIFVNAINSKEKPITMSLTIPLVEVLATIDFEAALKSYHLLPQIFDPTLSELNALCNTDGHNDFVSSISQQIHIVLNEGINETDADDCPDSDDDLPALELNHPFSYYILGEQRTPITSGMLYGN